MATMRGAEVIDLTACDDEPEIRSSHSPRQPPLYSLDRSQARPTIFNPHDRPPSHFRSGGSDHGSASQSMRHIAAGSSVHGFGSLFSPISNLGNLVLGSSGSSAHTSRDSHRLHPLEETHRPEKARTDRQNPGFPYPPPGHAPARSFAPQPTAPSPATATASPSGYMKPQQAAPPPRSTAAVREQRAEQRASSIPWFMRPPSPGHAVDSSPGRNYPSQPLPPSRRSPQQPFASQPPAQQRQSPYQPAARQQQVTIQQPSRLSSPLRPITYQQSTVNVRSPPRRSPHQSPHLQSTTQQRSPTAPTRHLQNSPPIHYRSFPYSPSAQNPAWHSPQRQHTPPSRQSSLSGISPGREQPVHSSPLPHSHLRQAASGNSPAASSGSARPASLRHPSPPRQLPPQQPHPEEPSQKLPNPAQAIPTPFSPPRQSPSTQSWLPKPSHPTQAPHPNQATEPISHSSGLAALAKSSLALPDPPKRPAAAGSEEHSSRGAPVPPPRSPSPSPPRATSSSASLSSVFTSCPPTPTFSSNSNNRAANTESDDIGDFHDSLPSHEPASATLDSSSHAAARSPAPASPASKPVDTPLHQAPAKVPPVLPLAMTPKVTEWSSAKIESSLKNFVKTLHADHGRQVEFYIASQPKRERQHLSSFDDFADLPVQHVESAAAADASDDLIKIRVKIQRDTLRRPEARLVHARTVSSKSPGEAVPRYRFHHVEIGKNILSPNTPLKFIPHIRDLEDGSEDKKKFDQWIEELESMERKSGFDTSKRSDKWASTRTSEYARLLSGYLDKWIARLGIDNCSKATLIRYMANGTRNGQAITPQQKSSLINSCGDGTDTPRAMHVASMFTDAFNRVFKSKHVTLYDVLKQDEAVESVFDPKKTNKSKEQDTESSLEQVQLYLGTYTSLECMICNTHSCEHGEFDAENVRRCFSIDDLGGKLLKHVDRRRERQMRDRREHHQMFQQKGFSGMANHIGEQNSTYSLDSPNPSPCDNQCYRLYDDGDPAFANREWTDDETSLLRSLHVVFAASSTRVACSVGPMVGRHCWEVYRQMKKLGLQTSLVASSHDPVIASPTVKPVTWYDRHRKVLNGDWSEHTYTHFHALREQREPCNHDGPCSAARGCPCVEAKLLCEHFCHCTAETCAYKFTGCACHGSGKTCYQRQKEGKPCICVQLNRECDPLLCGGCGARERADPANRDNDELHATGCQNVCLQRGKSKAVVLGQSQLEGCGYGLFTAEDIAADEFIIEYIGELITHDEGVRREARRGDVFNQESNASYLFTLLEQDGIWVDAAIYGNLSRYINHASEHDKRGCNITPKILYVNGEFRIRFTAMRDIKAGEELFFNYGENFPNLTKKLLEDKASASDDDGIDSHGDRNRGSGGAGGRRAARQRTTYNSSVSRTATQNGGAGNNKETNVTGSGTANSIRRAKSNGARKEAPPTAALADEDLDGDSDAMEIDDDTPQPPAKTKRPLKRKRQEVEDDDGDDENEDTGREDWIVPGRRQRPRPGQLREEDTDDSDEEFVAGRQSRRRTRTTRRQAKETVEVNSTAHGDSTGSRLRGTQQLDQKLSREDQHARHDDMRHDVHENDNALDTIEPELPQRTRRATRQTGGDTHSDAGAQARHEANGSIDAGAVTDGERRRKRLRTTNGTANGVRSSVDPEPDAMAVDSDEPAVVRPQRQRRSRQQRHPELLSEASEVSVAHQPAHQQQQSQRQLRQHSVASSVVPTVHLGTTDDDQASVASGGQPHGRQTRHSSGPTVAVHATRRTRHAVPDTDEDDDTKSQSQSQSQGQGQRHSQRLSRERSHQAEHTQRHEDDESEDGHDDGRNRGYSQRQRQRPARYRTEEAH